MYKRALAALSLGYLVLFIGVLGLLCMGKAKENDLSNQVSSGSLEPKGMVGYSSSDQHVVEYLMLDQPAAQLSEQGAAQLSQQWDFSEDEIEVLQRIVEAEAGGEDGDGKLLVANVVLNRVLDEDFPDTIREVVFQRSNGVIQFSPVANGRYDKVKVSQDTVDAVQRALEGEDLSQGALYFAARKYADSNSMRWFDEKLTFVLQHGGHEFFR